MSNESDFKKYSQSDLETITLSINREKYPERFRKLLEEIANRKKDGTWQEKKNEKEGPNLWILRGFAFATDVLIISGISDIFQNFILVQKYPLIHVLMYFIVFVSYFLITERPPFGASPGKKVIGLGTFFSSNATWRHAVFRPLIAWSIVSNFLSEIGSDLSLPPIVNALFSLPMAVGIYNLFLLRAVNQGLMIQDRFTQTNVDFEIGKLKEQATKLVPNIALLSILVLGFYISSIGFTLYSGGELFTREVPVTKGIKNNIEEKFGFWARADAKTVTRWPANGKESKEIELTVQIPFRKFDSVNMQDLASEAIKGLTIQKGIYQKGKINVTSKISLFRKTRSFELTFPK